MMKIRLDSQDFLTVPEFARKIHKPKMTIYRWAKSGKLVCIELGGVKFIPASELKKFQESVLA